MPELAEFRAAVDTSFSLGGNVLRLAEAEATGERPPGMGREPFRLVFLGPVDPILPQRTYRLEHDGLGTLEIFIVPIARDEHGTRYEAIFA